MKLVSGNEILGKAIAGGYAVPSFCVWNADVMDVVMRTAERMRAPVMLMTGPVELGLMPPRTLAAVARAVGQAHDLTCAVHLDHGDSIARARECIAAGYSSVMLDLSSRPFEENVAGVAELVRLARPDGVPVEAELGAIGKVDDSTVEGSSGSTLTDPEKAAELVQRTGVDSLAVSIGNAHGNYVTLPKLDFDRLEEIRRRVEIPLVLHGGSGTPEEDLRHAISLGIAKVNVASDLVKALRETMRNLWNSGEKLWIPEAMVEADRRMEFVVEVWIRRLGAEGKA